VTARKASWRAHPRYEWPDLVQPLRRYYPADVPSAWEQDFKIQVEKIVAVFTDEETPLVHWLPAASVIALEVLTKATRPQLECGRSHAE
jgi:hypothetical protein